MKLFQEYPHSRCYACRPVEMAHIGDYYYPEGIPTESSNPDDSKYDFLDETGNKFWICYTKKQMEEHMKRNFGICFPYMPLIITEYI